MQRAFTSLFSTLSLAILSCLIPVTAKAQVTPDGTTSTTVNQTGNSFTIEQGDRVGDNLFHSFNEFSVPTGGSAGFNNAGDIANIFSRVTGGNISNIDGLLSANATANLYLINPNGIVFGENASLNLGGSFFASTADSLLFESDTEFSASNPQAPPLLEVSIPIGLNFRNSPGEIINRSTADNGIGLEVFSGNTIALIGGNINFEAGRITARGGNVELGGLSQAGIVSIEPDNSLTFPADVAQSNITLANASIVDVAGTGGGNVTIDAQNLSLEAGGGSSIIGTGILSNSTSAEAQAGNINIDVAEKISLSNSGIFNQVLSDAVGNSGNIIITSGSLEILNGGRVDTGTFGTGNSGLVDITTTGNVTIDGENLQNSQFSIISSGVDVDATGNAGGVKISANNLALTNNAQILTNTFGEGDAGNIDITTTGDLTVDVPSRSFDPIGITSVVERSSVGNSGNINISASNLTLTNNAEIATSTSGEGDAGNIDITTIEDLTVDTPSRNRDTNGIASDVESNADGNAGDITISSANINVINGGRISANSFGRGNSGNINIVATENITIDGENLSETQRFESGVNSVAGNDENSEETSGEINITAANLALTNGARISTGAFGEFANGGNINIDVAEDVLISGGSSFGFRIGSRINSSTDIDINSRGNAGNVTILATNLILTNGGTINAQTSSQGAGGNIRIEAIEDVIIDGIEEDSLSPSPSRVTSEVSLGPRSNSFAVAGNGGDITISSANLTLTDGGKITAGTVGEGSAGDITIASTESIFISGSIEQTIDIFDQTIELPSGVSVSAVGGRGNGGNINIFTDRLNIKENSLVDAGNFDREERSFPIPGTGQPGNINIEVNSIDLSTGGSIETRTQSETGRSGIINLQVADNIALRDDSSISAQALENANGGNLNIDTDFIIAFDGDNDIIASAEQGQGGNININAEALFGIEERPLNDTTNDINASSEFSLDGTVDINNPTVDPTTGLINLPASVSDATDQISQNPCQQGIGSEFIVTGKGGLPRNPADSLNSNETQVGLVEPLEQTGQGGDKETRGQGENVVTEAVPAMGWVFNNRGEVTLTAYSNTDTERERSSQGKFSSCSVTNEVTDN